MQVNHGKSSCFLSAWTPRSMNMLAQSYLDFNFWFPVCKEYWSGLKWDHKKNTEFSTNRVSICTCWFWGMLVLTMSWRSVTYVFGLILYWCYYFEVAKGALAVGLPSPCYSGQAMRGTLSSHAEDEQTMTNDPNHQLLCRKTKWLPREYSTLGRTPCMSDEELAVNSSPLISGKLRELRSMGVSPVKIRHLNQTVASGRWFFFNHW